MDAVESAALQTKSLNHDKTSLQFIRRLLALVLFLGLLGAGSELLLVGHTETVWQWVPLLLIPLAILMLGWIVVAPGRVWVRIWQSLMLLFVASGFLGLGLHWKGKVEFKSESSPSLTGLRLFWEALKSESPPPLAPGIMIQMGLLGLAYAYRHPALQARPSNASPDTGENE